MCAKKKLKLEILEVSKNLFNNLSWSKTSLRKVASELNISDGNLRYHYKTKEDIVLGLFSMMTDEIMEEIKKVETNFSLTNLSFKPIFKIMYDYRFFFLESYFIKKAYESYMILFSQLEESRKQLFITQFNQLKAQGVLSQEFSEGQYEMLFEQIFIISDSWIKYAISDDESIVAQKITHYSKLCYALLTPYMKE